MIYEQELIVRGQEVNQDKFITNKALLELFSNITMKQSYDAGHTSNEGVSPVSWIVLGWNMKVFHRVRMFEKIRVATWVHTYNRVRSEREYAVYDEKGEVAAIAIAQWAALDGKKGTFLRLNPELMDPLEPEPDLGNFPGYQFPLLKQPAEPADKTEPVQVYRQMIDYNGHLHNSEYLNLADQIYPIPVYRHLFNHVEVIYKKQILPDETVILEYRCIDERHVVTVYHPENGELCAMVIQQDDEA